ncbi:MAG: hypothetical protein ACM30I_09705 [Gemmatimonas sp.]
MLGRVVLIAAALLTLSGCVVYERDYVSREPHSHHHYERYGWR